MDSDSQDSLNRLGRKKSIDILKHQLIYDQIRSNPRDGGYDIVSNPDRKPLQLSSALISLSGDGQILQGVSTAGEAIRTSKSMNRFGPTKSQKGFPCNRGGTTKSQQLNVGRRGTEQSDL